MIFCFVSDLGPANFNLQTYFRCRYGLILIYFSCIYVALGNGFCGTLAIFCFSTSVILTIVQWFVNNIFLGCTYLLLDSVCIIIFVIVRLNHNCRSWNSRTSREAVQRFRLKGIRALKLVGWEWVQDSQGKICQLWPGLKKKTIPDILLILIPQTGHSESILYGFTNNFDISGKQR